MAQWLHEPQFPPRQEPHPALPPLLARVLSQCAAKSDSPCRVCIPPHCGQAIGASASRMARRASKRC